MKRRRLFATAAAMAIGGGAASSEAAGNIPRVGYLTADCTGSSRDTAFLEGLRECGYVIGKDILVEARCYGTDDEARGRIDELIARPVDILFVAGPEFARHAMAATRSIPIVCGSCGDPIETGLVTSLGRPGGNLTGFASLSAELIAKRVELIKEVIPGVARIAIMSNPNNPGTSITLKALDDVSRTLGVTVHPVDFRSIGDFAKAFEAASRASVDVVLVADDPYAFAGRAEIGQRALQHRLPTMAGQIQNAEAGCLIAYGPNRDDLFRRAGAYVDKILKGARPGDLPIEQPTKFELAINLKTGKALGITIPQSILLRADQIIE